ncbi:hypothetical protein ART_4214 [Arthrobacter sp. PAMC 25486]|nr:hypothetical protein ART_4214 [Arthrobacter sp. PAMC 25486]
MKQQFYAAEASHDTELAVVALPTRFDSNNCELVGRMPCRCLKQQPMRSNPGWQL